MSDNGHSFFINVQYIVGCHYNTFWYIVIKDTVLQWQQQTTYISPSRASYRVHVMRFLEKIDHITMAPQYTSFLSVVRRVPPVSRVSVPVRSRVLMVVAMPACNPATRESVPPAGRWSACVVTVSWSCSTSSAIAGRKRPTGNARNSRLVHHVVQRWWVMNMQK